MHRSYDAVLTGNCLEWKGSAPDTRQPTEVKVIVREEEDAAEAAARRRRALAALEELAARGGIKSIPDPAEWHRQNRTDRPLPGRDV
ncbi:MAG: hypothetical protein JO306_06130 [Gemmatimonadetes bacterium]|nr:hypothetical protein [Gemmatimonadota bacterium]